MFKLDSDSTMTGNTSIITNVAQVVIWNMLGLCLPDELPENITSNSYARQLFLKALLESC